MEKQQIEHLNQTPQLQTQSATSFPKIAIGVIAILLFGFGAYILGTQKTQPTPLSTRVSPPTVQPTTMFNPTINWKTYTNTQYKFQIQYPSEWNILSDSSLGITFLAPYEITLIQNSETPATPVTISVEKSNNPQQAIDYFETSTGTFDNFQEENITIGGISSKKITSTLSEEASPFGKKLSIEVLIPINKAVIHVSYLENKDDVSIDTFNQILSTFKFTQ